MLVVGWMWKWLSPWGVDELEVEYVGRGSGIERYAQYGAVARIVWCGFGI